ncbi:MAG: hypothetical protein KIS94_05645 [Chitinophagales bacterium]|nr:hypothetical protein [Chitinophagales bacterium]
MLPDTEPQKNETLKSFLDRIVPGIINNVVSAAEDMDKEGENWGVNSIQKLFKRAVPENLINQLKKANNSDTKALNDGNSND